MILLLGIIGFFFLLIICLTFLGFNDWDLKYSIALKRLGVKWVHLLKRIFKNKLDEHFECRLEGIRQEISYYQKQLIERQSAKK